MQGMQSQSVAVTMHYTEASLDMLIGSSFSYIRISILHLFLLVHVVPSTLQSNYCLAHSQDM